MESLSSAWLPEPPDSAGRASTSKRARLYAFGGGALMLVSELEERSHAPHGVGVEQHAKGSAVAAAARDGDSLLLVVLQGELVLHAWHLSFEEEGEESPKEKGEVESDTEGEGHGTEDDGHDTDDTEEGYLYAIEEEENEDHLVQNSDDLDSYFYHLKLRVWHRSLRVHLILFDKENWLLTKQYSIHCLSSEQKELINREVEFLDDQPSYSLFLRSDYEGMTVPSHNVAEFVEINLLPGLDEYDFQQHQLLGKGAYSNVILGKSWYDHNDYAIKVMRLKRCIQEEPREVAIHSYLSCSPYIVRFSQAWIGNLDFEYEEDSDLESSLPNEEGGSKFLENMYLCISMEFGKRTLDDYLVYGDHPCDVDKSNMIFLELIKGLKHMEDSSIIHRDLKPTNVLLGEDGRVKIADFGHSCFCPEDTFYFEGTPDRGSMFYSAPELESGLKTSFKSDMYSIGVIYLSLFKSFKTKWELDDIFSSYHEMAASSQIEWETGDVNLFRKMISKDPLDRPSASFVLDVLESRIAAEEEPAALLEQFAKDATDQIDSERKRQQEMLIQPSPPTPRATPVATISASSITLTDASLQDNPVEQELE